MDVFPIGQGGGSEGQFAGLPGHVANLDVQAQSSSDWSRRRKAPRSIGLSTGALSLSPAGGAAVPMICLRGRMAIGSPGTGN